MRCPDCNKFVSMENGEPEVELDIEYPSEAESFTIELRADLIRQCADCGTELKRASVSAEETVELMEVTTEEEARCISPEAEDRKHVFSVKEMGSDVDESGGGRYAKNVIGVNVDYVVTCDNAGCKFTHEGQVKAETNAGSSEESV